MKKFLFGVAFLIVGAGIAVGALMLTGRLADSTTPTSHTRTTSGRVVTTYSPTPTRGPSYSPGLDPAYITPRTSRPAYTTTTIDAALAALCIDLQDKARAAIAAFNAGETDPLPHSRSGAKDRSEVNRTVRNLQSHCPSRYWNYPP